MDVRTRIKRYLANAITEEIDDQDDIFALRVVNSMFAIQLVLFVEKEFSITAEREDLDIKNFCSIAALTNFVLNKLSRAADREHSHGHPTD